MMSHAILHFLQVMDQLNQNEVMHSHENEGCNWVPEYGAWMIEATPSRRE
jgi:glutamate--cysteine ligase catalytic subunit